MTKYIRSTVFAILGLFLLYSLSKTIFGYQKKLNFTKQYKKDYESEMEKNKRLKSDLLKSQDYHTVERNIRDKLNLSKPNEVVLIIPKPSPSPIPTPTIQIPVYKQWIEVFSNKSG